MVIFHSYVSLPEGNIQYILIIYTVVAPPKKKWKLSHHYFDISSLFYLGYHKIISQYRLLHHLLGHVLGGCPMCATRDHQRDRNQWVTWFGRVFCPVLFGLWSMLIETKCAVTFPDIPLAETRYRKRCWDPRCSQLVRMLNWQDETVHRHFCNSTLYRMQSLIGFQCKVLRSVVEHIIETLFLKGCCIERLLAWGISRYHRVA